jgi:hypothetical protein
MSHKIELTEPTYELILRTNQMFKFSSTEELVTAAIHVLSSIGGYRADGFNEVLVRSSKSQRERWVNVPGIERVVR